ncbi:malonyl-CoA synthase [Marinobacterium maritimum]|uniref:Malonyl-CoA synthase n=1 Tax=Marinobacterium maritimum TaxID=500162 RepID=A0ABP3TJK8_9GAMM
MNLFESFQQGFQLHKNKVALRVPEQERLVSFGELDGLSARMAHQLVGLGVEPGDRVAVQVDKSVEALALYLAVLRAGAIYLPLNTAYMPEELAYFVSNAEPRVVVTKQAQRGIFAGIQQDSGVVFSCVTLESDRSGSLMQELGRYSDQFETVARSGDDIAAILYTSGTTGRPKGAMISHDNLASNARTLSDIWGWKGNDVLLHALPIFHVHGLFVACNISFMNATEMVFLSKFDAQHALSELPSCTVMMGVPTFYTRLLGESDFTSELCVNMRLFISGSAPLLEETFEAFEARTGHRILERYGMTETGMNTSNPLRGARLPGTVGFPLPGTDVRVMSESGELLSAGEVGSLQVKGPNVFQGYWRMPEKTAADFTEDGYFITGDLGKIDAEGYVAIVGREKDLIISGGYNIYPKEVELVLNEIPGVVETAVFAYKHADFGEGVAVAVVAEQGQAPSEEQIVSYCRDRLAAYKVPRRIIYLAELPRNTMGKVQKNLLRDEYGQ